MDLFIACPGRLFLEHVMVDWKVGMSSFWFKVGSPAIFMIWNMLHKQSFPQQLQLIITLSEQTGALKPNNLKNVEFKDF